MHPRNIYNVPPDFKQLAIDFPDFRKHLTQDISGKISLNFKNSEAVRCLTQTLLKKDFDLSVVIPPNSLVPTVPQRLNYLLWVEDLISLLPQREERRKIIDIGTGASCIFPLIGSSRFQWDFLASESHPELFAIAVDNVEKNNLQEMVKVIKVDKDSTLLDLLEGREPSGFPYDLCMCNPPFFTDSKDSDWKTKARSDKRPPPKSSNFAQDSEKHFEGGEVAFTGQLIEASIQLKDKVSIYTTMLGKKSSLKLIKEQLNQLKISQFVESEFVQGKTMRWGIAWSFLPKLDLQSARIFSKTRKPLSPITYFIPTSSSNPDFKSISQRINNLLAELKMEVKVLSEQLNFQRLRCRSKINTWSNQRRKRREQLRKTGNDPATSEKTESKPIPFKMVPRALSQIKIDQIAPNGSRSSEEAVNEEKLPSSASSIVQNSCKRKKDESESETSDEEQVYLLDCILKLKRMGGNTILELKSETMTDAQILHQVMQFFKNRLK